MVLRRNHADVRRTHAAAALDSAPGDLYSCSTLLTPGRRGVKTAGEELSGSFGELSGDVHWPRV